MTDNLLDDKIIETPDKDNSPTTTDQEKLDRYKQQMEGSKQEAQKFRNLAIESEVKRAEVDANSIIELHGKDPKMAEEVAKKFWYSTYKDVETTLNKPTTPEPINNTDDASERDKFNQWYEERKVQEESSNAHSEADKLFATLEWDTQTEARKHYKMMTDWRNLTVNQATEMAKMATLYVNKDNLKSEKLQEWLLNFGNTWLSQSAPAPKSEPKNKEFWAQIFWGQFSHLYK